MKFTQKGLSRRNNTSIFYVSHTKRMGDEAVRAILKLYHVVDIFVLFKRRERDLCMILFTLVSCNQSK
jgi:hypothetical protein